MHPLNKKKSMVAKSSHELIFPRRLAFSTGLLLKLLIFCSTLCDKDYSSSLRGNYFLIRNKTNIMNPNWVPVRL